MHSFTNNIYYHGINRSTKWSCQTETYLEPCQISKMECFAKIINGFQPLTIFARRSILDVRQGSMYFSVKHLVMQQLDYLHKIAQYEKQMFGWSHY